MAPQASWPRDMPADSLESGSMGILESGNAETGDPATILSVFILPFEVAAIHFRIFHKML